jgi:hypothetical protein
VNSPAEVSRNLKPLGQDSNLERISDSWQPSRGAGRHFGALRGMRPGANLR